MRKVGDMSESNEVLVALTQREHNTLLELERVWVSFGATGGDGQTLSPALRCVAAWAGAKINMARISSLVDQLQRWLDDDAPADDKPPWEETDAYEILSLTATSIPDELRDVLKLHYVAGRFDGTLVHLAQISKAELLLDSVDVLACHAISARIGRWRFLKSL